MILMTMIARVADGLPLTASIQEDEQVKGFLRLNHVQYSIFQITSIIDYYCPLNVKREQLNNCLKYNFTKKIPCL